MKITLVLPKTKDAHHVLGSRKPKPTLVLVLLVLLSLPIIMKVERIKKQKEGLLFSRMAK
jgi:hypothetical protein